MIERATPMPIGLANPRDDVWLEGNIECGQPLTVPWFDKLCVYYSYKEEQRVQRYADGERPAHDLPDLGNPASGDASG